MKKNIFFTGIVIACIMLSTKSFAQQPAPKEKKTEEIIIRKNGDKDTKMTIEINGDSVTVNGKPLADYNGDVTVRQRDFMNRDSHNFLYAPRNENMNVELFKNDVNDSKPRAFLGVLTDKSGDGVAITEVVKGSSAEKSGLLAGDIITKLDDKIIASPADLMDAVKAHKPGDAVKVYYVRDNKKKDTEAKLGETKQDERTLGFGGNPGMNGNNFNFKMPEMQRLPGMQNHDFHFFYNQDNKPKLGVKIEDTENGTGVKILHVEEGSPADKAGMKPDDIITELNGEKVNDVNEAVDQLNGSEEKETVHVKAMRNNAEMNFEFTIPKKLNSTNL
ncbi:MAG: PDZ domain-containing protein [Ginsengibacter sp.]